MTRYQYVDISGVGNSGKSTISDLLREFDRVFMPEYWFEFDLLRLPNGLLDLRHRLKEDWSPVRSHYAIGAFRSLVEMTGRDPAWWDLSGQFTSTGQRLDHRFHGQYRKLLQAFVSSFIRTRYVADWPYDELQVRPELRFIRKFIRHGGGRQWLKRTVLMTDGTDFDNRARELVDELYSLIVAPGTDIVGLHNSFEAFNPLPALEMLGDAKQIIVTRDPRDVYVSGLTGSKATGGNKALLPFDNDGQSKSFLGTENLQAFVTRTRTYYDHLYRANDPRVLRLRFEDIVLDYERMLSQVCIFLQLDPARHVRPKTRLIPEASARNVGLWRRYSDCSEIDHIARELPELLYCP